VDILMVVNDDPNIRELVRLILKKEGFEVLEASDGVDALAKLENSKVDLIVLDIMMPNMDGWEFCREARRFWDLPILMLTAKGETSQRVIACNLCYICVKLKMISLTGGESCSRRLCPILTDEVPHI